MIKNFLAKNQKQTLTIPLFTIFLMLVYQFWVVLQCLTRSILDIIILSFPTQVLILTAGLSLTLFLTNKINFIKKSTRLFSKPGLFVGVFLLIFISFYFFQKNYLAVFELLLALFAFYLLNLMLED